MLVWVNKNFYCHGKIALKFMFSGYYELSPDEIEAIDKALATQIKTKKGEE